MYVFSIEMLSTSELQQKDQNVEIFYVHLYQKQDDKLVLWLTNLDYKKNQPDWSLKSCTFVLAKVGLDREF